MFVKGVSQAQVGQLMESPTGSHLSPATVLWVFHTLEAEYEHWKSREPSERYAYADETRFT
jgi:hypothetical protein